MDIIKPVGYFMSFLFAYIVTTLTIGGLMVVFAVPVVTGVFILSGVFTVMLAIIAAIMHDNYTVQRNEVEKEQLKTDHDYRMELLEVAKEEAKAQARALGS